jgi:hypothetical protein
MPAGLVERTMQMRRITDTNYCKTHKRCGCSVPAVLVLYTDQALTVTCDDEALSRPDLSAKRTAPKARQARRPFPSFSAPPGPSALLPSFEETPTVNPNSANHHGTG